MNVWITGASRGIGKAIAEQLLADGHRVAVSARNTAQLDTIGVSSKLEHNLFKVPLDVTSQQAVETAAGSVVERLGSIDLFIPNSGVTVFKSVLDTSVEEIDSIIDTNLKGTMYGIKAVLPHMIERRQGWIIALISVTAKKIFANSGAYAASKSGVLSFIDILREEVRDKGIRVTAFIPGATDTDMWPERIREKYRERMMTPEVVAQSVSRLLSYPEGVMVEEVVMRPQLGDL